MCIYKCNLYIYIYRYIYRYLCLSIYINKYAYVNVIYLCLYICNTHIYVTYMYLLSPCLHRVKSVTFCEDS